MICSVLCSYKLFILLLISRERGKPTFNSVPTYSYRPVCGAAADLSPFAAAIATYLPSKEYQPTKQPPNLPNNLPANIQIYLACTSWLSHALPLYQQSNICSLKMSPFTCMYYLIDPSSYCYCTTYLPTNITTIHPAKQQTQQPP